MSINVCNNNSMSAITSTPSGVGGGALNLISTQTASSSSTISFTSGIDSTYKIQGADRDLGGGTFYLNRGVTDGDSSNKSRGTSNIILMEVSA